LLKVAPLSVPLASADTVCVSVLSTSVSLLSKLPLTGFDSESSVTAATSATATGASFSPKMLTAREAELEPPWLSELV
jgi:hypothetical protein